MLALSKFVFAAMVCVALCTRPLTAADAPPLGTVGYNYMPVPSPSFEKSLSTYILLGQAYQIPRNLILSLGRTDTGEVVDIFMQVLLPNFVGLSRENARCFLNPLDVCSRDVVMIGLTAGKMVDGPTQLKNIKRSLATSGSFIDDCGFTYYRDKTPPEVIGQGSNYFVHKLPTHNEESVLICPRENATHRNSCKGQENFEDGNSFYYNFHRSHVCEWEGIESKTRNLIGSFKS